VGNDSHPNVVVAVVRMVVVADAHARVVLIVVERAAAHKQGANWSLPRIGHTRLRRIGLSPAT
jgi:hypothetical protein